MFHTDPQMFHSAPKQSMEAVKCSTQPLTTRVRSGSGQLDLNVSWCRRVLRCNLAKDIPLHRIW